MVLVSMVTGGEQPEYSKDRNVLVSMVTGEELSRG